MTHNVWQDFLENKTMWNYHKPDFSGVAASVSAFTGLRMHQTKAENGELIGQESVRGLNGKSLAFAENSRINPMLQRDRSLNPTRTLDLRDHWGLSEKNMVAATGAAILEFMAKFPPPIKTISAASEFCRICPAWAVDKYTDASARTYVGGDYNRWGNAPSIYCSPVVPHDLVTLGQAMEETIGKKARFSPPDVENIRIPHHTLIEMVRNYRAHLGENYIFWGRPVSRSLMLLDMSFSDGGSNAYLARMETSPSIRPLLNDCCARGLIPARNFGRLMVDKDERKSILDLFGWGVTNGLITGPSRAHLDGIFFTGSNSKRELGAVDAFQSHFVLFSKANRSLSNCIKLTRRIAVRHDKANDLWVVTETTPSEWKMFFQKV